MKIVVLAGGLSPERKVSQVTGKAIEQSLVALGHQVNIIDPGVEFPLVDLPSRLAQEKSSGCDFVWIALHGAGGEDGRVQALLDWLELPYQGSGYLASALAMDKEIAKRLFRSDAIPTPTDWIWKQGPQPLWDQVGEALGCPVVVKPVDCGSSVGVSIVETAQRYEQAVQQAKDYSTRVLLESYIPGKEITVSILDGVVMPSIEIVPVDTAFYTYDAKYGADGSRHLIPCSLTTEGLERTEAVALRAYHVLGCEGLARVDLRVDGREFPWVLEVNTLPGMTPTSLCPDAAAAWGWSFQQLVARSLELGWKRKRVSMAALPFEVQVQS